MPRGAWLDAGRPVTAKRSLPPTARPTAPQPESPAAYRSSSKPGLTASAACVHPRLPLTAVLWASAVQLPSTEGAAHKRAAAASSPGHHQTWGPAEAVVAAGAPHHRQTPDRQAAAAAAEGALAGHAPGEWPGAAARGCCWGKEEAQARRRQATAWAAQRAERRVPAAPQAAPPAARAAAAPAQRWTAPGTAARLCLRPTQTGPEPRQAPGVVEAALPSPAGWRACTGLGPTAAPVPRSGQAAGQGAAPSAQATQLAEPAAGWGPVWKPWPRGRQAWCTGRATGPAGPPARLPRCRCVPAPAAAAPPIGEMAGAAARDVTRGAGRQPPACRRPGVEWRYCSGCRGCCRGAGTARDTAARLAGAGRLLSGRCCRCRLCCPSRRLPRHSCCRPGCRCSC